MFVMYVFCDQLFKSVNNGQYNQQITKNILLFDWNLKLLLFLCGFYGVYDYGYVNFPNDLTHLLNFLLI